MSASTPPATGETASEARDEFCVWSDRALIAGGIALALFALLQVLQYKYGRDQGIYAVVADSMVRGGMPYRDMWDFKPPGVFFVYALARAVFGPGQWGIRLLQALCLAALVPAFMTLSRRLFGTRLAGFMGAVVAIVVDAQLEFWHTAQPESFGGVLTVIGLVLVTDEKILAPDKGLRRRAWAMWVGAGACFGLAGLMKPQMGGASLVASIYLLLELRRQGLSWKRSAMSVVGVGAGTLLSLLLCVSYFKARGAWGDLYQTLFVFAPGYGSTTWSSEWWPNYLYYAFEYFSVAGAGPLFIGMALTLGLARTDSRETRGLLLILGIVFLHLVGIAIQSKFFPYHFAGTYPLGAFIGGLGLWKLWRICQRRGPTYVVLFVGMFYLFARARTATRDLGETFWDRSWQRTSVLMSGDAAARERVAAKLYSVADVDYEQNMKVVRWLQANTAPTDPVYIWGFEPFIYDVAQRMPATRYIYNVPQRVAWFREESRGRLMEDLRRSPPRAIVVEHRDVFPVVTGDSLDSEASLLGFWDLKNLIDTQYSRVATIEDFDVYLRR
ncbi:MAG: glycosyltransferase family 39 protein [Deltaproteobacteria bacterium]|nr:glycosyltransferase family 39 protein [Deltaproteobacteria bacterium]